MKGALLVWALGIFNDTYRPTSRRPGRRGTRPSHRSLGDAKRWIPRRWREGGMADAQQPQPLYPVRHPRRSPRRVLPGAYGGAVVRIACRCPARHWQSWHSLRRIDAGCLVARTSTCFTSSGPTLKSWQLPTSRCTHEVPCLGTWSESGQHDCFRVKTRPNGGAERGNTVRAGGICGPRDECSLAAGWLPRSSESS